MAAPKYPTSSLKNLYAGASEKQNENKKAVETLIKRLNDKLASDPAACKKAALVLENWLHQKPKK
jgi:hypothetical protein